MKPAGSTCEIQQKHQMTTQGPKPENALPLIERALEWRLALLLISLVLAIDVARVPMHVLGFPFLNW